MDEPVVTLPVFNLIKIHLTDGRQYLVELEDSVYQEIFQLINGTRRGEFIPFFKQEGKIREVGVPDVHTDPPKFKNKINGVKIMKSSIISIDEYIIERKDKK